MNKKCPISAQLVIPASFAECLTYEKQIQWLKREIDSVSAGVEPSVIAEIQNQLTFLSNEITNLHNEIDGYNIQAIQESIEQINLNVENLKNSIELKQDKLTFDNTPTLVSQNPVTSSGIKEAIDNEGMRLEQLINDKVDETTFNDAFNNIIDNYATNEELANYATKSEISDMATKTELSNYATKSDITDFVTNETLNNSISVLATKSEISDMATQTDLLSYATKEELIDYVTDTELENTVSLLATKSEVANKQDKLTFDNTPTLESQNPVTSDGIKKAIDAVSTGGIEVDDNVTSTSENAVKSSGIYQFVQEETADFVNNSELANYATKSEISDMATKTELSNYATKSDITDFVTNETLNNSISVLATKSEISDMATQTDLLSYATKEELIDYVTETDLENSVSTLATKSELANKQDKLTFDNTPTLESQNPVTSDGIKKAIDAVSTGGIEVDATVSQSSQNPVSSNGIYNFVVDQLGDLVTNEQLETKQDKLTFDATPTAGSTNPVTSNGIKTAIDNSTNDMLTNTVAMKTYATKDELTSVLNDKVSNNTFNSTVSTLATKTELSDYAKKDELLDYATQDDITGIEQQLSNYATNISVSQALENKQDVLVFDDEPTADSQNPVRSAGIFNALQNVGNMNVLVHTGIMETYTARGYNNTLQDYTTPVSGISELILNIPEGQKTLLLNPDSNFTTFGFFNLNITGIEDNIVVMSQNSLTFATGAKAGISNDLLYFYTFDYGIIVGYNNDKDSPTIIDIIQQNNYYNGTYWLGKNSTKASLFDTIVITFPVKVLVKSKISNVLT